MQNRAKALKSSLSGMSDKSGKTDKGDERCEKRSESPELAHTSPNGNKRAESGDVRIYSAIPVQTGTKWLKTSNSG